MTDVEVIADDVARAHDELGHQLGWRFLYSPAGTLSPSVRLAFVGLNPGGSIYHPPIVSVEEGNAYRVERWGAAGARNPLQVQIGLFYDALAARIGANSDALMDETLAVNFCPFRSSSWESLIQKTSSIDFSRQLWNLILDEASPRVVVCLGVSRRDTSLRSCRSAEERSLAHLPSALSGGDLSRTGRLGSGVAARRPCS